MLWPRRRLSEQPEVAVATVGKALDLLDVFTRQRPQVGLSDIARLAGVNKATCHRLLSEMESRGLVEQVGPAREYRLGPAVLKLAYLREAAVPTRDAAMPVLQALARATGETAHLSLLVGGVLRTLAFAYSSQHGVKVTMEDADTLPFHATASGAAVLAHLPPEVAARILEGPLPPRVAGDGTTRDDLRERIAVVQVRGWAETLSTFEKDVQGLAVPLFDAQGTCIGAVAVAAAAPRMTPDLHARVVSELTRAGTRINALWGGQVPPALETLWHGTALPDGDAA
ncbi:MAG: IclR family transcriptional regulator [Gemmobacter sp.]